MSSGLNASSQLREPRADVGQDPRGEEGAADTASTTPMSTQLVLPVAT